MNREVHVRICERLGVQFPGPTRPFENVAMVEMRTQLAIERAGLVTLHLQPARRSSIPTRTRAPVYRLIWLLRAWRRALQHIESQHPPNKEYRYNCPRNMDDPVATCFRIAEIEHHGIVARGSNKAPIGSWRKSAP